MTMKNIYVPIFTSLIESSYKLRNVMIQASLKIQTSFINQKNLKKVVFPEIKILAIVSKGIVDIKSSKNQVFR